nr:hypothetical protein Itr_chr15CG15340 [Ipomoea trifida]
MNVKAGIRLAIAEAKVGELYSMPIYCKVWDAQLCRKRLRHHLNAPPSSTHQEPGRLGCSCQAGHVSAGNTPAMLRTGLSFIDPSPLNLDQTKPNTKPITHISITSTPLPLGIKMADRKKAKYNSKP